MGRRCIWCWRCGAGFVERGGADGWGFRVDGAEEHGGSLDREADYGRYVEMMRTVTTT